MCTAKLTMKKTKKTKVHRGQKSKSPKIMLPNDFLPGPKDILCGRGNVFSNHEGNRYFGRIIRANLKEYIKAANRPEKIKVVDDILLEIREHGARFAKVDNTTKQWFQLNDVQAHQKVGHAIRDTIRLLEKDKRRALLSDESSTNSSSATIANDHKNNKENKTTSHPQHNVQSSRNDINVRRHSLLSKKARRNSRALLFPNIQTSQTTSKGVMDDILRLSFDTVDYLNDDREPTSQKIRSSSGVRSSEAPNTTSIQNTELVSDAYARRRSYLLQDEYPEINFNFSADSFFGEHNTIGNSNRNYFGSNHIVNQ